MVIEYVNRRDKTYYLHQGKTKTGKPKYFFAMKKDGDLVDSIPKGYEIYENPNAQVFLRKITPKVFTEKELALVEDGVRKFANLNNSIVNVEKNSIVVYLADQDLEKLAGFFSSANFRDRSQAIEILSKNLTYSPMMRFVLDNAESREFIVERWCFRGAIDDWIDLDSSNNLEQLVKKYCPHLGKQSFYDLM